MMQIHGIPKNFEWRYVYDNFNEGFLNGYKEIEIIEIGTQFHIRAIGVFSRVSLNLDEYRKFESVDSVQKYCNKVLTDFWKEISDFEFIPGKNRLQKLRKVYASFTKNKRGLTGKRFRNIIPATKRLSPFEVSEMWRLYTEAFKI